MKVENATGKTPEDLPSPSEQLANVKELIKLQSEYRERTMKNIARAQERQKKPYDQNHNTNTTLKVGDKVLKKNMRNTGRGGEKLDKLFSGPCFVHKDIGKGRFRLKTHGGAIMKQSIHCC